MKGIQCLFSHSYCTFFKHLKPHYLFPKTRTCFHKFSYVFPGKNTYMFFRKHHQLFINLIIKILSIRIF